MLSRLFARRCAVCDEPLASGARPQARTCSDKCRQALSRSQRPEARKAVESALSTGDVPAQDRGDISPPAARWQEQDPGDDYAQRLGHWVNPDEPEDLW